MCRKPITDIQVVEESRYLLQRGRQGTGQLWLNSQAPQRVRNICSYRLKLGLRGTWSAHVKVPYWSVELVTFPWLICDTVLFREFMMSRWTLAGFWLREFSSYIPPRPGILTQITPEQYWPLMLLSVEEANDSLSWMVRTFCSQLERSIKPMNPFW